jgi:hypothetical protein
VPTPPLSDEKMREAVEAVQTHGSINRAADALGLARSTVQDRVKAAARKGIAPGHWENGTAPGYAIGKVTIQRGPTGAVERTWERQSPDAAQSQEAFAAAIRDLCLSVPPAPLIPAPVAFDDDLLNVIPMGDPHFGLLSWKPETGESFDLEIAEAMTFGAVDKLVSRAPPAGVGLLLNLGDYFHADDSTNRTPRGQNQLDVDGRFQKVASVGFRAMLRCIERMLETHAKVIVRNNPGNHDPHQALMLNIAVGARFHDNPRVYVDPSPSPFYYYRHGKVLIGSTHGDGAKLADLPLLMADDVKHDWAASDFRVWHVGHFHHNQRLAQKDLVGCEVETHRTLAAGDAWHRHAGYRALRDMKVISYHREYGEDLRIRCGAERLAA